jgi:hypothetical protein
MGKEQTQRMGRIIKVAVINNIPKIQNLRDVVYALEFYNFYTASTVARMRTVITNAAMSDTRYSNP